MQTRELFQNLFIPVVKEFLHSIPEMFDGFKALQRQFPNFNAPQIATAGQNFNVHIDKIETQDAESFVNLLPTLVHQYK